MGSADLLVCPLFVVGNLARKLLVAIRTCPYFRPSYHPKGEMVVLEEGVQGRRTEEHSVGLA